jgi:DNA-binding transcriptional ArsR family regulator
MSEELANLLAHPLRARLLFEYEQQTSPSKLARRLQERVNLVSYHTNVLREHGWIELVRTERRRGATEHFYRTTGPHDIEDEDWEQVSTQLRRAVVLGVLGITRDEARTAALHGGFDRATMHLSRSLLDLDDRGVAELASTLRQAIDKVQQIAASARTRDADGRERHEVVIQFFRVPSAD